MTLWRAGRRERDKQAANKNHNSQHKVDYPCSFAAECFDEYVSPLVAKKPVEIHHGAAYNK
jgi:hypothetical protein